MSAIFISISLELEQVDHRDYKRIEAASDDESRDKLNKSDEGPGI